MRQKSVPKTLPWRAGMLAPGSNISVPREGVGSGGFLLLILCWAWGKVWQGYGILVQTLIFVLSGSQPGALYCQLLDSGKTDTSPLSSLLKCRNFGCMVQSSSSLPREKLGAGGISVDHVPGGGIMVRGCHEFSYQLWYICFCTFLGVQESFSWSLDFSQREIVCMLLNWEILGLPVPPFHFYPTSTIFLIIPLISLCDQVMYEAYAYN